MNVLNDAIDNTDPNRPGNIEWEARKDVSDLAKNLG
jgi:hypothetical protein